MTALAWDQVGDRRYESGVDRGVLYTRDGIAVPWNGLVSVTENTEREVKSYFIDGIKFLDHQVPSVYSAKLGAFTYPDELDELIGVSKFVPGVFVHDQRSKLFHLSYRTREGNDLEGPEADYKIHIVYNVLAVPSSAAFNSISNSPATALFEWSLTSAPPQMLGIRPTSHISLHSRSIDSTLLEILENLLYGTDDADPSLPDLVDLLALAEA